MLGDSVFATMTQLCAVGGGCRFGDNYMGWVVVKI